MSAMVSQMKHRTFARGVRAPAVDHATIVAVDCAIHLEHETQHNDHCIPQVGVPVPLGAEFIDLCHRRSGKIKSPLTEI